MFKNRLKLNVLFRDSFMDGSTVRKSKEKGIITNVRRMVMSWVRGCE